MHTARGFHVVDEPEAGVFLELSCLLYDSVDAGNLIYASSAFF